jgi:hypothetical protein
MSAIAATARVLVASVHAGAREVILRIFMALAFPVVPRR